jgi:2-polyprenyl-6-hydroxyphenyl methylase/3-demethylubiquinone-9 3-methyltransferase
VGFFARWGRSLALLREIAGAYRHCPVGCRLRVLGRYILCPFGAVLRRIPADASVLDVGCGDGLLLFLVSREAAHRPRTHVGIDIDDAKIRNARSAGIPDAEFLVADIAAQPPETYDCVTIIDVLYLLPKSCWVGFLKEAFRVLRPDGVMLVKEVADRPRWKYWIAYLEELVSVKVIGMTKGGSPHLESADVYRAHIEVAGGDVVEVQQIGGGRPAPHVVFVARKRAVQ